MEGSLVLKGNPASSGHFSGKVVVVAGSGSFGGDAGNGFVLVTEFLTPLHTPLLLKAGAVVTDEGGMMSHSAIICREFGIPCVTGVGNATLVLKNVVRVTVDGNAGKVFFR
jgi:pyruvate,water dikinase